MTLKSFAPASHIATQKIAATTTSGVAGSAVALDPYSADVRVVNGGPNNSRVRFSGPGAAQACTATDVLVLAGTVEIFTKGSCTFATSQTDTGTAAMEFTNGEGF